LRLTGKLLSRHASGKANANSRDAAYFFRLHSDLMVTVRSRRFGVAPWLPLDPISRLGLHRIPNWMSCPPGWLALRYMNQTAQPALSFRRDWKSDECGAVLVEVGMTSRLRELIQQLGEAIHESVIESEQIAGVVQTIREHGFDVMLMLEATIGLNEVAGKEGNEAVPAGKAGAAESNEGSAFTSHDLSFLRSLRISVEGEEEGAAENDTE
jgi:hypothetical protein